MKTVTTFIIASGFLTVSAIASDQHTVGSCPTPITIDNQGVWQDATLNQAALSNMRELHESNSNVSAVYTKPDGSHYNILSLKALDTHQGIMTSKLFETMRSKYNEKLKTVNTDEDIKERVKEVLDSKGIKGISNEYKFSGNMLNRDSEFIVLGVTTFNEDGVQNKYLTAQKNIYLHNCILTMNFTFPDHSFNFETVIQAVSDVSVQ